MIQLRRLAISRAMKPLLADVSMQLHGGWKVGVTGANGCGKSSFFALLRGELTPDSGDIEAPPGWRIGHVAQEIAAADLASPALQFVLDGDTELREAEAQLAAAEASRDGHAIAIAHERLLDIDGYAAVARASAIMAGLGFVASDGERAAATFSGGWRVRLTLARALASRADMLLLDEPTNHLDLDAVLWLEAWLQSFPGLLLVISHDRDFLDAVVDHIAHIEATTMQLGNGDYSTFERRRAERLALQQNMFAAQQREIAHLHAFVERFRAKATKAKQAQSRLKALARMEVISGAHVDAPFHFRFLAASDASDPLLTLRQAAVERGGANILGDIDLTLRPGARIGLLGRNGAGKSTLMQTLAGDLPLCAGRREAGRRLRIGYFAQHQLEQLRGDESPLQQLLRIEPQAREQDLRDWLGGFDFRGDMALTACGDFSGGEKARLALALLIRQRPNLLLLDEPTNHLDLEMREALALALQETDAAVVLAS